jgi:hypothetical protein
MKWKTSETFFPMTVRPHRNGPYELKRADDSLARESYRGDAWQTDVAGYLGWRGIEIETTKEEVLKERRALSRYRYSVVKTHKSALKAAVWLARYHASARRLGKAFRFYLIANRIDPSRLPNVDREWMERSVRHIENTRDSIDAQVDAFFQKRGVPQLKTQPIFATRGA